MNRRTAKSYVIIGGVLALLGGFIFYSSFQWKYYTRMGPGPGFFPFWIGLLLAALGILLGAIHLNALRNEGKTGETSGEPIFTAPRLKKVGLVAFALIGCSLLLNGLGFILSIALFSIFLMQIVGKWGWVKSVCLSAGVSTGLYWGFKILLHIPLPSGILKF